MPKAKKIKDPLKGVLIEELINGILHVKFPSQQLLASTFLRFQEHFENPKFKGKVFTLQEFVEWYIQEKGKFNYYEEWDGFNFPSHNLQPFLDGKFDPLSEEEKAFLQLFAKRKGKFYIIGTVDEGNPEVLKHEIGHGLFHLNENYKKAVRAVLKRVKAPHVVKHLKEKLMYHEDVVEDELHAYIMSEIEYLEEEAGIDVKNLLEHHHELNKIFKEHFKIEHAARAR